MFGADVGSPQLGSPAASVNSQSVQLLGNQQGAPPQNVYPNFDPGILNTTAPISSSTNPSIAYMVKALKGDSKNG